MQHTLYEWIGFSAIVVALLVLDMVVFHRKDHEPSLLESAGWSAFWIVLSLLFNCWVWLKMGAGAAAAFFTGFLVEKSLSMDNVFVFAVIFRFFGIPLMYQYRVLFWGIIGAIVMRLAFILAGAALLRRFDWVMVVFGAFLLVTAVKLARSHDAEVHPERNILLRIARRLLPVTRGDHRQYGHAFFVREGGRLCITPMFLVLLVIESTDVVFAIDSVPAIFGITKDPYIVFTSNICAILGLRALYFLLAGAVRMFRYLHYGLAAILAFVGLVMIADYIAETWYFDYLVENWGFVEGQHVVPTGAKLVVVGIVLTVSIGASIIANRREAARRSGQAAV